MGNGHTASSALNLARQLGWCQIRERYEGTLLGCFWLLLQPLCMLLVYVVVFGEVLQLRFEVTLSAQDFAYYLFTGLLVFNSLAEVMTQSPQLLLKHRELLLNTPLPAWILPLLPVMTSIFMELLAVLMLVIVLCLSGQFLPVGWGFFMAYLLLRVLFSLSLSYLFSVLGVFFRDLGQIMPAFLSVLLLTSPILYPLEVIPEHFLGWYEWNVIGQLAQGYRDALLEGAIEWPHFWGLLGWAVLALLGALGIFHSLLPKARYVL